MRPLWLLSGFVLILCATARADQAADEALVRGARITPDGPGLVAFFQSRVARSEADEAKIAALIDKLATGRFREREKASAELIAVGAPARPFLLRAADHKDAEVRKRAAECLAAIDAAASVEVELAALRLLTAKKPEGACKALLLYLPSVRDSSVEEETFAALLALGVKDGKADTDIEAALKEKNAVRRGAAAVLLGRSGSKQQKELVRQLLKTETDALVRLRAAQGLVAGKEKSAVALLLPLLTDAPFAVTEQARDLLILLAADKAPSHDLKDNREVRKKCRDDWERWWDANQGKLDLARADVDLPWLSANAQARAAVQFFIKAIEARDAEKLKQSMDVPFNVAGYILLKTREELDQMLIQGFQQAPQQPKVEFGVLRIVETKQFLAKLPNAPKGMSETMTEFLKLVPASELRIVHVTAKQQGRNESAYLFVRVKGGKGRVVGMAEDPEKHGKKE
jgi:hypothetical protein